MKKIFNLLLALPLLMLAGCASDEPIAPAEKVYTYTLNACFDTDEEETRVSHADESESMNCKWEMGDVVKVNDTQAKKTFDFKVTEINTDGTATLTYQGTDAIANITNFTGTVTYNAAQQSWYQATSVGKQTANKNCDHLKYSEVMTAHMGKGPYTQETTLRNVNLNGTQLFFAHSNSVFRIKFKAPAAFTSAKLTLSGDMWQTTNTFPSVDLNFSATAGDEVTAYIMDVYYLNGLAAGKSLRFTLKIGSDTYCYNHTFGTPVNQLKARVNNIYWLADLGSKLQKADADPIPVPVDLGLSVKWASVNLGASKPEEDGDRYGWGCVKPYDASLTKVSWTDYFSELGSTGTADTDCGGTNDPLASYVAPKVGDIKNTQWDAANKRLGGKWRMPTKAEVKALFNSCSQSWTYNYNGTGVAGVKLSNNGKSIFLPAVKCMSDNGVVVLPNGSPSGNYWISTTNDVPDPGESQGAEVANTVEFIPLSSYVSFSLFNELRYIGCVIRPVLEP
ncbi:MAG: hypothetical protein HUK02_04930 [Bacteroidaceae bacterium]|nr:hypothetical protein [Bacteroidaceae bacterium]